MLTKCELQLPTKEKIDWIRSQLGTSQQDIDSAITVLREWLQQQSHLPDVIDDRRLESMYINCKCSLERTKRGLDAYYSLRTTLPELLMNRVPIRTLPCGYHAPMPRLTPDGYRVWVLTVGDRDASSLDLLVIFRRAFMMLEVLMVEDYSLGDVMVIDLRGITLGQVLCWDVGLVRNLEITYKTAYCRRLKGIHLINVPKIIDAVLTILKAALSQKLQKRITVHLPDAGTIFDVVPKEYMPDILGGTAGSMEEIENAFADKMEIYREWFLEQDRYVADESRRPDKRHTVEDIFGISGSFKRLAVD